MQEKRSARRKKSLGPHHRHVAELLLQQATAIEAVMTPRSLYSEQVGLESTVIASVIASFCFIEVTVNDALEIIIDEHTSEIRADPEKVSILRFLEADLQKKNTSEKAQCMLKVLTGKTFDISQEPYQSVELIRRLRNFFVHQKPEWHDNFDDPKLASQLQGKFSFAKGSNSFPEKILTSDCARWAYDQSKVFTDELLERIGIPLGFRYKIYHTVFFPRPTEAARRATIETIEQGFRKATEKLLGKLIEL